MSILFYLNRVRETMLGRILNYLGNRFWKVVKHLNYIYWDNKNKKSLGLSIPTRYKNNCLGISSVKFCVHSSAKRYCF